MSSGFKYEVGGEAILGSECVQHFPGDAGTNDLDSREHHGGDKDASSDLNTAWLKQLPPSGSVLRTAPLACMAHRRGIPAPLDPNKPVFCSGH